jgi:hypothetical protein
VSHSSFSCDLFCALSLGLIIISNATPSRSCVYICKFQFRPIHPPSRRLSRIRCQAILVLNASVIRSVGEAIWPRLLLDEACPSWASGVPRVEMAMGKYPPGISTPYPYPQHKNNPTGLPIYTGGYGFTPIPIPMWVWVTHRVTHTHKN